MPRPVVLLAVLVLGCSPEVVAAPAVSAPVPSTTVLAASPQPTEAATATKTATTTAIASDGTFVVWMPDGLPPDFQELASSVVDKVTIVHVSTLHIAETRTADGAIVDRPPSPFVIPVQGVVLDTTSYSRFVAPETADVLRSLQTDEVVLPESSARLRRLAAGDRIVFAGGFEVTVAAILPDAAVGSAEIVIAQPDLAVANSTRSYALVEAGGSLAELDVLLNEVVPGQDPVRVRDRSGASGGRPAVRSQLFVKQTFGEFAYRPTSKGRFVIDPEWVEANITTVDLPLLGTTTCHRAFADLLALVMGSLVDDGLGTVVDRGAFRGCWVARYMVGSARISRHAWGVAADINFGNSLSGGAGSPVNEELLARMAAVGITSGHSWTNPDPGHFEYYGFDAPLPTPDLDSVD